MQKYNFIDFLSRSNDVPEDLEFFEVTSKLPAPIKNERWIAGGALRRTLINMPLDSDVDYFFSSEQSFKEFCSELEELGAKETASNEHQKTFAITVGKKDILVQGIRINYYESIEDVLDSFDFTITQFGYDGESLYCGDYSLWDLSRRKLALHKLTYGVSTVRRMIKYTKQGFTACNGAFVSILEAVANDPQLIEAEIKYID